MERESFFIVWINNLYCITFAFDRLAKIFNSAVQMSLVVLRPTTRTIALSEREESSHAASLWSWRRYERYSGFIIVYPSELPGIIWDGGDTSPVKNDSRPYPHTVASTYCCHIKKLSSVNFTEVGGFCSKPGIWEFCRKDWFDVAFDSVESAIYNE